MHHITQDGEVLILVHHIQQRRVVFVNKDYHLPAGLLAGTLYQVCQLDVNPRIIVFRQAIFLIIFPQPPGQILIQFLLVQMLGQAHVKVQHRVFRPLGFQLFDGKPFEKVFLPGKIAVQRRGKQ